MKKYCWEEINNKCKKCLGCNRLELENFKGVYRCENYIEKEKTEDEQIQKQKSNIR